MVFTLLWPNSSWISAQILHLSDLHFGTLADARNFHSQLAEDLTRELGCTRLDALICSGDLTLVSSEAEYASARTFIDRLRGEFGLARERIVLVPGNHDLSWPLARAAYMPGDASVYAAASEHEQRRWIVDGGACMVRDEDRYRQRFAPYGDRLHHPITGEPYPLDYADQFSLHHWPELSLLVLGLNSAWEIDHVHKDRAGIHPEAISKALNRRQVPARPGSFRQPGRSRRAPRRASAGLRLPGRAALTGTPAGAARGAPRR